MNNMNDHKIWRSINVVNNYLETMELQQKVLGKLEEELEKYGINYVRNLKHNLVKVFFDVEEKSFVMDMWFFDSSVKFAVYFPFAVERSALVLAALFQAECNSRDDFFEKMNVDLNTGKIFLEARCMVKDAFTFPVNKCVEMVKQMMNHALALYGTVQCISVAKAPATLEDYYLSLIHKTSLALKGFGDIGEAGSAELRNKYDVDGYIFSMLTKTKSMFEEQVMELMELDELEEDDEDEVEEDEETPPPVKMDLPNPFLAALKERSAISENRQENEEEKNKLLDFFCDLMKEEDDDE